MPENGNGGPRIPTGIVWLIGVAVAVLAIAVPWVGRANAEARERGRQDEKIERLLRMTEGLTERHLDLEARIAALENNEKRWVRR